MAATPLPNGKQQFIDIEGAPLVGGTVEFYEVGGLTPKDTWQDADQTVLNDNPITLDERGQAVIFGSGQYRQIVKDSAGNVIWDENTVTMEGVTGTTITNALTSLSPGLEIAQYSTQIAAYGLDIHQYGEHPSAPVPGDGAVSSLVIHNYSDRAVAMQIDNTRSQSILVLKNAINNVTSNGTIGSGSYLQFTGESATTPGTIVNLGELTKDLIFLSYDPLQQFTFDNGLVINTGPSDPNAALVVTGQQAGLYAAQFNGAAFGAFVSTTANSGTTLGVVKNGTGAGVAVIIQNKGTDPALEVTDASSNVLLTIDAQGQIGVGTAPGTYGVAVLQANATQIYAGSSGANNANVVIDSSTAGHEANVLFDDAGVTKFTVGKNTANGWRINGTGIGDIITISAAGALGFFGSAGTTKPTVTGSRGGNAALASLLTALAGLGILTDSSS